MTFKGMHESLRCLVSQAFFFLKLAGCCVFFLTARPWDPLSSLANLPVFEKGLQTGGFSRVLGVVGFISILMYQGDGDQLVNGPIAAV